MANFFLDNLDLSFHFKQLRIKPIVELMENHYTSDEQHSEVLSSYEETESYYRESLELLGKICANDIAPLRAGIDEEGTKLLEGKVEYAKGSERARQLLSESGFMGAILPRKHGGAHVPASIYMMMIEIVSRADASLMTMFGYQDVGELIARFGTPEQGEKYLPKLASGEHLGAIVLSEPGAGSDLQAIKVKASQNEDGQWVLNGTKHFISNGCGEVLMVLARSEPKVDNIFGLSLFVCRGGGKVKVNRVEEKMGLHGSPTCELEFIDAPAELIGKRKFGLTKYILESLSQARFSVAAQSLGIAQQAYDSALEYAHQRRQFGRLIVDIPAVADLLLQMQVALESSRALLYLGSYWLDLKTQLENYVEQHKDSELDLKPKKRQFRLAQQKVNILSPMVKYVVTEAANKVCYDAQQIFGGMGYMKETGIEQLVRDVRITTIYEGTTQVQVAASVKAVLADILADIFAEKAQLAESASTELQPLFEQLAESSANFKVSVEMIKATKSEMENGASARQLVDCYAAMLAGYCLLEQAACATVEKVKQRKRIIAKRHIAHCQVNIQSLQTLLRINGFSGLEQRDLMLGLND